MPTNRPRIAPSRRLLSVVNRAACPALRGTDGITTLPCGVLATSGGGGVTVIRHELGATPGTVILNYDAFTVPDQIDVDLNGVIVATTGGPVSGYGYLSFAYSATLHTYCTVTVTGPSGTAWEYTVGCPA